MKFWQSYGWRLVLNNALAFFVLVCITFILLRWLPGDPLDVLYSSDITRSVSLVEREAMRESLGWHGSIWAQGWQYIGELAQGHLGYSIYHAAPVSELLAASLPWSLALVLLSIPLALVAGVLPGLIAGSQVSKRLDYWLVILAAVFSSLPSFALALLLSSIFAHQLGWFPLSGGATLFADYSGWQRVLDYLWHGWLPLLVLAAHGALRYFYLARGLAQQLSQRPFIAVAKARGLNQWQLIKHYYWPNAWPEILTRMTGVLPSVLGSTLFVEVVFSYPGIGQLLLDAIYNRDFPVIQGAILTIGFIILITNSLIDLMVHQLSLRG
ncbi:ABC transporter permease [Marinospirillum insulare]|uniref:ABC transporter permease n=1 Tax=Marinospirillum insulare TaxID=217169 RepID=A0ABQ5ZVM7_9GAMM|nr:ABC transporter permease [Marinospirillum insulare]GLR63072.1 ABC transporter permease [Marinospirillum insulare]